MCSVGGSFFSKLLVQTESKVLKCEYQAYFKKQNHVVLINGKITKTARLLIPSKTVEVKRHSFIAIPTNTVEF